MKIICIDGFNSYLANNFYNKYKKKYKIVKFKSDINNISELINFILKKKVTIYIRFAGLSRSNCKIHSKKCYSTNFIANQQLVNFIKLKKIKLIFMSSSHIYSHSSRKINEKFNAIPNSNYGRFKLKSENYIKKYLDDYLIMRIFNIYGKDQPAGYFFSDMKEKIRNKKKIIINNSYRDFIHVNEVSRFINFALNKKLNGIFNVGSGKSYKLSSIIKMISEKMKIKPNLLIKKKIDKLVSDNTIIKNKGFIVKNEKNLSY